MNPITSFQGRNGFLSNFHPSPVEFEGLTYPTVEHAFQAAKTHDHETRKIIRDKAKPGQAKHAGGKRGILKGDLFRSDWESVKVDVMRTIVRTKFQNPELAQLLLDTGDSSLIEGNIWNDTFWGVCKGKGKNTLGKILEEIRAELRTA